jgi:DNA-binding transcriptional LysR family regulator
MNESEDVMTHEPLELAPLEMLVAVATYGTVTEAARRLHLSQPAATHQIHHLERSLGHALFERRGRRLELTEAGRLALARARRILGEVEGLRADLRAFETLETGEIRLGGGATATVHVLPRLIADFRSRYPGVSFYLREGTARNTLQAIANGELDLGIVTLPSQRPGLIVEPWLEDAIVFVAWPDAPLAGKSFPMAELNGVPFIHSGPDTPLRSLVEAGLSRAGLAPRVVMELESVEAIKTHVAEGLGYSALGIRAVERELAEGRLVRLQPEGLALTRCLALVYRENVAFSPAVRTFLDELRARHMPERQAD